MASNSIAIPTKDNFDALRLQYLQQAGLDPTQIAGLGDSYIQNTNNLYQSLAASLLGLENQRAATEVDYSKGKQSISDQNVQAIDQLRRQLAFRGILGGSAGLDRENQINTDYAKQQSSLQDQYDRAMAGYTGGVTTANQAYTTGLENERLNLSGAASRYLDQLAQNAITQKNAETSGAGDVAQSDISTQIQQAVAKATAQQNTSLPDLSQYSNLFVQNTPQQSSNPYFNQPPGGYKPPAATAANPYLSDPFGTQGKNPMFQKPAAKNQFGFAQKLVGVRR